jgi:integrase/recombinase XerD
MTVDAMLSRSPAAPQTLDAAVDSFLLSRRVGNCSACTIDVYGRNLRRFAAAIGGELTACTLLAVQGYLTGLREKLKPVSVHQHFRVLRAFFRWSLQMGLLLEDPMRGMTMRIPQTLPRVPEDHDVRRLLVACGSSWEDIRNRALIALLADSGLRVSEATRLQIDDMNFKTGTIRVRSGKGGRDRVGFFGATAAAHLRTWLAQRPHVSPENLLFCTRDGRRLSRYLVLHTLHRLSVRAGLSRKISPHGLRHYAATSLLKRTGDLELVRRVLGHATLAMALRYAQLAAPEIAAKFARASPLDHLWHGTRDE